MVTRNSVMNLCMLAVVWQLIRQVISQAPTPSYSDCTLTTMQATSSARLLYTQIRQEKASVISATKLDSSVYYIEERSLDTGTLTQPYSNLVYLTTDTVYGLHLNKLGLAGALNDYLFYISYGSPYKIASIKIDPITGKHTSANSISTSGVNSCSVVKFVNRATAALYVGCESSATSKHLTVIKYIIDTSTGAFTYSSSVSAPTSNICIPNFMVELGNSETLAFSCRNNRVIEFIRKLTFAHVLTFNQPSTKVKSIGLEADVNVLWDLYTDSTNVYLAKYDYNSVTNTLTSNTPTVTFQASVSGFMRRLPVIGYLLIGYGNKVNIFYKDNLTALNPASAIWVSGTLNPESISSQALVNYSSFKFTFTYEIGAQKYLNILTVSFKVVCTVSNCNSCQNDSTVCDACLPLYFFYTAPGMTKASCISSSAIPAGYGPDTSAAVLTVAPCSIPSCVECFADKTDCQVCKTGYLYIEANKTCLFKNDTAALASNPLILDNKWWDTATSLVKLQFSEDLNTTVDKTLLILTVSDQVNNKVYTVDSDKYDASCSDKTLSISLRLDVEIIKGQLRIQLKTDNLITYPILNTGSKKGFIDYPVVVEGISVSGSKQSITQVTKSASSGMQSTVSTGRSVGSAISTVAGSTTGAGLDKLVSEFSYMQLVEGPNLYYPDTLLTYISGSSMLPASVGNPFKSFSNQDSDCTLPGKYIQKNINCNLLSNYGEDLTIMFGTLAINIAISLLCYSLLRWTTLRKTKRKTYLAKTIDFIYRNYGMKLFAVKLDGMSLEILVYAMISIPRTTADNRAGAVSIAVSWILITYFVLYVVALIKLIADVKKILKVKANEQEQIESRPQLQDTKKELKQEAHFETNKLWWAAGPLEDFKCPSQMMHLYLPVIGIIRAFVIAFILFEFSEYPVAQSISLTLIQFVMVVWTVTASIKASRYDNIKDAIDAIGQLIFLFMKSVALGDMAESTKQYYIGGSCVICLMIILLNNIIFMIVAIVMVIIETVKSIKSACEKTNKQDSSTRNDGIMNIDYDIDSKGQTNQAPNITKSGSPLNRSHKFSTSKAQNIFKGLTTKFNNNRIVPNSGANPNSPINFRNQKFMHMRIGAYNSLRSTANKKATNDISETPIRDAKTINTDGV